MPLVSISVQTDDSELLLPDSHEAQNFHQSRSFKNKYLSELRSQDIVRTRHEGWMSHRTNKCLFLLLFVIAFGCIGLIFFGYYCTGTNALCEFPTYKTNGFKKYITTDIIGEPLKSSRVSNLPTFEEVVSKDFQFDIEDHDVMVFLHMQKTGGTTFGHHLVKDLELERDCVCHRKIKKRCTCLRPGTHSKETWLFSRYSTGWKCGLHADWTELTACVDYVMDEIDAHSVKRRYFYITFLREPIHRYLSEYRHVKRGATWKNTLLRCNGRPATEEEVPPCYEGETWADVTLEDFVSCKSNLANNRQTRMLADLSLVNCYDTTSMKPEERDTILLASAKNNLHRMALFGLTEFQEMSQYIFEETFNLKFSVRFDQYNSTRADKSARSIPAALMDRIRAANHLDLQLYEYAKELLQQRFKRLRALDTEFDEHFNNMGHAFFSWDDIDKDR